MFDLERFLKAQENTYDTALKEIQNGQKETHWMWFIFPQLVGLGSSYYANYYGISGLEEAQAYMQHELLRSRLLEISNALLKVDENIIDIFGYPDCFKLQSSMTLFSLVDSSIPVFQEVLEKFYEGERDEVTLKLLYNKKSQFER